MPFKKGHQYRWKPGQSGNPKGRPKEKTMDEHMRAVLGESVVGPDGADVTRMEIVCRILADKAIRERDLATISLLAKRMWPEINRHEVSGSLSLEQQLKEAADEVDRLLGIDREDSDAAGPDTDHPIH